MTEYQKYGDGTPYRHRLVQELLEMQEKFRLLNFCHAQDASSLWKVKLLSKHMSARCDLHRVHSRNIADLSLLKTQP